MSAKPILTWQKACDCQSTAATNQIVTKIRTDEKTFAVYQTTTFYPMPICLKCETPWKAVDSTTKNVLIAT